MMRKLAAALNVESGEGRVLLLLVAHSFCIGLARLFVETAADAIFLARQDIDSLSYVYLGVALVGVIIGAIVAKAEQVLTFKSLLSATLIGLIVSLVMLWALLFTQVAAVPIVIAIWNDSVEVLTTLELGALAARMFNVRQGKRLFAVAGSGDVLAGLLGGLCVPFLVEAIGTPALLLLAAGAITIALLILRIILANKRVQAGEEQEAEVAESGSEAKPESTRNLIRDRYLWLIVAFVGMDELVYFLLHGAFLADSQAHYPNEDALAGFFGLAFGLASVVTLIFRLLVSARFLRRYGVVGGLILLPALLFVGLGTAAVSGVALQAGELVFWAVIVSRMTDAVISDSVLTPARLMLYLPLTPRKRVWSQAFVETICMPLVTGLSGVVLIVFMWFRPLSGANLSWLLLVILVAWALVGLRAGHQYKRKLVQALSRRSLRGIELSLGDATSASLLMEGLSDPHPSAVIYCLNQLHLGHTDSLDETLISLLDHPAPEVRIDVLEKMERLQTRDAQATVQRVMEKDSSPVVQAAAVKTLVSLGATEVFDVVSPYLDDVDPVVTAGAMVGLLLYGGIEGVLLAGESLIGLASAELPERRLLAAQVLGSVAIRNFYRPLLKLLGDPDVEVRRAALAAAARVGHAALWPVVVASLADADTRHAASKALVAAGDPVLAELVKSFKEPGQDRTIQTRMVRIAAQIGGNKALEFLRGEVALPDSEVRALVLSALADVRFQASASESRVVWEGIKAEAANLAWLMGCTVDVSSIDASQSSLMAEIGLALTTEMARVQELILLQLSLVFPSESVLNAKDSLVSADEEKRAYALEILDNLLPQDAKSYILPLLESLSPELALPKVAAIFPQQSVDVAIRLADIAERPLRWISPWCKACALDAIGRIDAKDAQAAVISQLSSPDPIVRSTAVWTLGWIADESVADVIEPLIDDRVAQVAAMAKHVVAQFTGDTESRALIDQLLGSGMDV